MRKGIFKRITAFMLAIAMVFTMLPTTVIASERSVDRSTVTATKDGITVTKHASFVKNADGTIKTDENGNPKIQIDFTVDTTYLTPGTETVASGTTDIVLVIDKSGSMGDDGKIGKAKEAAKDFVDKVLKYSGVRVGLVTFSSSAEQLEELTSNKTKLTTSINTKISASGGTFIQAGIKQAQEMLSKKSSATNKIIILLSDGVPTYSYEPETNGRGEYKTKKISAPLANPIEYTAYSEFKSNIIGDGRDSSWGYWYWSETINKATISQAYLAREVISGLNIYSVGYDISKGSVAEDVLTKIADKGKYSSASVTGTNDLASVITNITKQVEKAINGVNLVDQIPSQMTLVEGKTTTPSDITATTENGGIKFTWNGALEKKVYTMSFETVLDLRKLNAEDYKNNPYFNTNGTTVVKDGDGANSSTLSYGTTDDAKITLDSPQLQLQSYKYDIHYFYNNEEENSAKEEGYKFAGQQVNVEDKNKDASEYVLDRVEINNSNGTFGNLTIDSNKTVKVYYKTKVKKQIKVIKDWQDGNNQDGLRREVEIKITDEEGNVIANNVKLNEDNKWTYVHDELLSMEETYTVTELTSIAGYGHAKAVVTEKNLNDGNKQFVYTLTNTHTPDVVSIPVTVEWIDDSNRDGFRPESGSVIKLHKQVEGEEQATVINTQNVVSAYSFTDLPQYENGKKITYTVTQDDVDEYITTFEHTKDENDIITAYKFINTHTPATKDVTVKKEWKDGNNAENSRKDVTVVLYGGSKTYEAVLTSENGYTHTFENLFVKEGGQTINYYIQEKEVPTNYTPQYSNDGLSVTNVYKQGVNISKTVTKVWDDNGNVDKSRPDSVTINLLANGEVLENKTVQLPENGKWSHTWDELPEYDTNGAKITYTVQEVEVGRGYTANYTNDTFTITNTRPRDVKDVTVTKKWVGDSHVSRLVRPEKITVQLYANGTPVGDTKDITGSDDVDTWTATWNNMPTNYLKDGVSTPIEYTVAEVGTYNDYNPEIRGLTITNTYVPVKITRTVNKVWVDDNNHDGKQPKTIKVKLTGTVGNTSQVVSEEEITLGDNGWQHIFNNLPRFVENGENKGAEITYTVTETPVAGYETDIDTAGNVTTITNSRANALKNIVVTKVWNDDSNRDHSRPDSIQIQLKRDGVAFGEPVTLTSENASATAANTWTYTFPNLEVYGNVNAQTGEVTPYVFTVDEVTVPDGYSKEASDDNMSGEGDATVTITNTHDIETVDFEVEKVWEDFENNDGVRPTSIEVVLKANGAEYKKVTLNSDNRWQHTWEGIPKNADGEPINYTVEELTLPTGYTSGTQYSDITNGKKATITNTYSNKEQKQVKITKVWDNEEENHPERPTSVTVDVKRGNDVVTTVTLKAEEDWTKTISLDKLYRGNEAVYTVVETNVKSGYTPSYPTAIVNNDGILEYTIKNTYNVTKKSFTVTKEWNDNNNQDGVRPPSITVQLFKNGQVEGRPVTIIPSENVWTYTWPALETSRDGHENVYSVQEVGPIAGYTPASTTPVGFDKNGNATLTNNHTLEKTSLTVTKVWNDNDDNDDIRPDSIQVQLYKNNVEYGDPVTLTDNKLNHTWTDLDKNANGTAVTYTVKEVNVPEGYESNAAQPIGFDSNNEATITNTHGKDQIKLTIKKLWAGDSETNNERPDSITVKLYADGEYLQTVTLLKSENWTKEVTVDKKNNKRNISYTLKEVTKTSGYTLTDSNTVSGQDGELTVTNTYNVTKKSYTVTKSWSDADNQDGIRPTSIMVQLFKNHVAEGAPVEVKALDNWTYTWSNLEVSRDGNENVYTVKEVVPSGYTSSASEEVSFNEAGNVTITNTHLPEKTSFTVAKEWVDDNDNDGIQPQSIQVQLYKGTEPCGQSVTLSTRNQWTYEWTNLDKKANGVDIVYNVAEVNVPEGYKDSIVYSENHLSALITNTHEKNKIKLTINKAWVGDTEENNERPEYVDVNLYAGDKAIRTVRLTAENNWTAEVEEFQRFNKQDIVYSLAEVTKTSGYTPTYSNPVSGADGRLTVTNTYNVETEDFTVTKSWQDANNQDGKRPTSIKVQLYKNNVAFGDEVTITAGDKWTYTWTGLETRRDNDTFTYTVKEVEVSDEYVSDAVEEAVSFDNDNEAVITNTHNVAKKRFTVTKVWEDNNNNDGIRPESIQVKLFANGNDTGKNVTLTDNKLTDTWSDLDVYANGQPIEYTVQEVGVPTGYTSNTVYSTDKTSATITNTHTKNTIKLTITKAWAGDSETNNERPASVEVKLLADGEYLQTVTLTAAENWTKEVTVDQKLNKQDISYELVEVTKTSGYTPTYSDPVSGNDGTLTVTNEYNVTTQDYTVTKSWDDVNNQDGKRPTSIWVQLFKNGQAEGRLVEVKAIENWTYTWYDLETSRDGNTNTYTVQEVGTIDGYTSNAIEPVSFDNDGRVTITNTHKPARTSFSVEKVWVDDNNQDGIRPDSVTIRFFRDNEEIATSERRLTKGNWTAYLGTMFDYTNGVKHVYKVVEDSVEGYVATYEYNENTGKFTVTNTHTSRKLSPTVKFVWDDVNNAEGIRPTSMNVTIKGTVKETVDGVEVDKIVQNHTITVSNSTWTDGWTNLPEFYNGQKIFYTVEQAATPDKYTYVGTDTTSTEATFVITNKYVPMVDKTITVIWDDNNDNNKKRPTEVEIQPTVDGKPEGEPIKVNVENNKDEEDDNKWTTTVTLPKYDEEGNEIVYKVSQNEVPKYETSYSEDTLTITNKYIPDPVIIIPSNPPLKPLEPTEEPTEEPTVEPTEEPSEEVTVVPTEKPNVPGNKDDDVKEDVVNPTAPNHLQAPVTSDKETTDAQKGNDDTPKTSDDNNIMLYCLYMLLSATGIVVVYSRKRKNRE